jgi:hypothetical protein
MQSEWAGSKIAADERQFVLGNSYLIAAVSLLIGHLFYTRFVYLHAHGLIVRKQSRATKAVAKSVAPIAPAHSGRRAGSEPVTVAQSGEVAKSGKSARNELSTVSKRSSVKATAAKKTEAKRASSKSPATASSANKQPVKTTAEAAESSPATMNSFQSLLEKRKRDQRAAAVANEPSADEADAPATIKMSKAERRRARKAKRADRKAA